MMQNFMTQSLWGRGGGEGRSSHQLSAPGSPAKEGQLPDRFRPELGTVGGRGGRAHQSAVPGLNLGIGPARQHLCNLSPLICQMGQGSTLEGSCEAWQ